MEKLVILELKKGNFQEGFELIIQTVNGQWKSKLPPAPEIPHLYQAWCSHYQDLLYYSRGIKKFSRISRQECELLRGNLCQTLNQWFDSEECRYTSKKLEKTLHLEPQDKLRLVVKTQQVKCSTTKNILYRLPWHECNPFTIPENVEFALSFQKDVESPTIIKNLSTLARIKRVRILSILGNSAGINIETDRRQIWEICGSRLKFLPEPKHSEFVEVCQEQWDILCFSGHSESQEDAQAGWLHLNPQEKIAVKELKSTLKKICKQGLKLVIFNSCDGLGLAQAIADLSIPYIIVWREPVPDLVAQKFLKYFLESFAGNQHLDKSLHQAVSEAREKLQNEGVENQLPGVISLPTICQNFPQETLTWRQIRGIGDSIPKLNSNYQNLLSKVKKSWIEDVLKKSLYGQALIELGIEERFDVLENLWSISWQDPNLWQKPRPLPPGTRVIDKFDEMGKGSTLLILGEPGSGKTTTMLQLAADLIEDAALDPEQPIPTIFNLSTWSTCEKEITFIDWLIQNLRTVYNISESLSKNWIKNQKLLLLLDGLDEVKLKQREECLRAINAFKREYRQTEIVVCSRIQDYQALSVKLNFQGAIYIQSITPKQINRYFKSLGEELVKVQRSIQEDSILQTLAKTPLMLNIITVTYQGVASEQLPQANSVEKRRQQIFNDYIERMFALQRFSNRQYSRQQAQKWLIWIAQRMVKESQTIFFIEGIQPSWLPTIAQSWIYRISVGLVIGLIVGLVIGIIIGLRGGLIIGLTIWLSLWLVSGSISGFIGGSVGGLTGGIIGGAIVGLALWWQIPRLIAGFFMTPIIGLIFAFIFRYIRPTIESVDTFQWSWSKALKSVIMGLGCGFLFSFAYIYTGTKELPYIAATIGLLIGLINGFEKLSQVETRTVPNQGIWRSRRNAANLFGIVGLIGGIGWWLIFNLNTGLSIESLQVNLQDVLLTILFSGLMGGLLGGEGSGVICLQHLLLRSILYKNGYIPWNLAHFLDWSAECIFLQKAGGGYIFIHRLLLEHFAQIEPKQMRRRID